LDVLVKKTFALELEFHQDDRNFKSGTPLIHENMELPMQVHQLDSDGEGRSFALVLATGEDAVDKLVSFAREHNVKSGRFMGLGALSDVELGFFDFSKNDYHRNLLDEQVEIVSLVGNFSCQEGEARVHPHIVVARRDGQAYGGHLLSGHVKPTLEIMIVETPASLQREIDPKTGLGLIQA
jgi:uncharacterized protein